MLYRIAAPADHSVIAAARYGKGGWSEDWSRLVVHNRASFKLSDQHAEGLGVRRVNFFTSPTDP